MRRLAESNTGRFGADGCAPWFEASFVGFASGGSVAREGGEASGRKLEPGEMMFGRRPSERNPCYRNLPSGRSARRSQLKRPAEHLKTLKTILDSAGGELLMPAWVEVVLNVPVYQSFTYKNPAPGESLLGNG